jgi:transcriptional regulator with XRE-family HTH domain
MAQPHARSATGRGALLPVPAPEPGPRSGRRRPELAAYLRSRRARITPEAAGIPPGFRRRTPGLRREEVAQLAGVGVTRYTWLEQGRPINASAQVLDAVARVLQLDAAEREHLYQLAEVPFVREPASDRAVVGPELLTVLDHLDPLPSALYNARFDVLAANATYRLLWPLASRVSGDKRNVLYRLFTTPDCCSTVVNGSDDLPSMVAQLRHAYGRHVGEPEWEGFVSRLAAASPLFARMWESGDVARPDGRVKIYRHASVGTIRLAAAPLSVDTMAEHRLTVYTPVTDEDRDAIERLRAIPDPFVGCPAHGRPLSACDLID